LPNQWSRPQKAQAPDYAAFYLFKVIAKKPAFGHGSFNGCALIQLASDFQSGAVNVVRELPVCKEGATRTRAPVAD